MNTAGVFDMPPTAEQPRILYVTDVVPVDLTDGVRQRVTAQLWGLQELGEVDVAVVGSNKWRPDNWPAGLGRLVGCLPGPPLEQNLGWFFRREKSLWPALFAATPFVNLKRIYRPTPEAAARFRALRPESYDLVVVSMLRTAWGVGWTDPQRTILDLYDLESQLFRPPAGRPSLPARLLRALRFARVRRAEYQALSDYRLALVCSGDDVTYLRHHPRVDVLANCYWPHPLMDEEPGAGEPGRLLHVGYLGYARLRGMRWFIDEVLPRVRARQPEARLTVIGRADAGADLSWKDAPGVEYLGRVDDIGPHVRAAQVSIVPSIQEMGTRIKIAESLAFGKPVVSTAIGAYGLPMGEAEGVFRRDDAAGFADAVAGLLEDSGRRLRCARAGREFVRTRCSLDAFKRRLQDFARGVMASADRADGRRPAAPTRSQPEPVSR